jgi:dethiobiotin synthetase
MRLAQLSPTRTAPESYRFDPPVSPHLAARRAGVRIDLRRITIPHLPRCENLIAEGAGGTLVPINGTQLMTSLMRHLGLPVLLVTRTTLGTINHTLLSLAALRAAYLDIRGVIMVGKPNRENRRAIERYGKIEVIGIVPQLKRVHRSGLLAVFRRNFDPEMFRG